jgi:hypothetical protein
MKRMNAWRVFLGVGMMGLGAMAAVTTGPAGDGAASAPAKSMPAAPTINVNVVNWTVFVADVSAREMNRREAFFNTLPAFINDSRRERETAGDGGERPGLVPIGMVRITPDGVVNTDATLDVELSYKSGRVLGHWPPGKVRSSGLLWRDVHFAGAKEKMRELPAGGEGEWLGPVRKVGAGERMLAVENVAEPFLLYDVEVSYPLSLQVTTRPGGAFAYKVAQGTDAPMRDLVLYKTDGDGMVQTVRLETLEKAAAATGPGAATVAAPAVSTRAGGRQPTPATVWAAGGTRPANQPAPTPEVAPPVPALAGGVDVSLQKGAVAEDYWRRVLAEAGVSPADVELILTIVKQNLDGRHLTAVFRMDSAELDKVMPLEIVPMPKKVSRIALVVVTGIDPSVNEELATSIKQLGDPSWAKREAAMKAIEKLGQRARPALQKALKDKDVEVVYRVEQLLETLSPGSTAGEQPQN